MSAKRLLSDIVSLTPEQLRGLHALPAPLLLQRVARPARERSGAVDRSGPASMHDMLRKIHADGEVPRRRTRRRRARRARNRHRRPSARWSRATPDRCPSRATRRRRARGRRRPLPPSPAADVHGDRAHRRGVDPRRHRSTHATTRRAGGSSTRSPRSPPPTCRRTSLAAQAAARGLRLRLRYEYLQPEVDEDPSRGSSTTKTLAAVEEELRAAVERMWERGGMARRRRHRRCAARAGTGRSVATAPRPANRRGPSSASTYPERDR